MSFKLNVVILAAGKGARMYSETPKVLHKLAGSSLVEHVINTAETLAPERIVLVVGHQAESVKQHLSGIANLDFVIQKDQKGTAHAVEQAMDLLGDDTLTLVLYGDVPLIKKASLQRLIAETAQDKMAVLTCEVSNPKELGRIVRGQNGKITAIVEEKDATQAQKEISEINTGMMAFSTKSLRLWLPRIKNQNAQKEYYLTDIVPIALQDGHEVCTVSAANEDEISGVNNMLQLATLEKAYQKDQAERLMLEGVRIIDPMRFDLRGVADIETGVEIDINVILEGRVKLGKKVKIGANCRLKNCTIQEGSEIFANSVIEDAVIGRQCSIGPFARIRPGTELRDKARIGNFVETKNAVIGEGSKVNHLSYVGDSKLGRDVNIGAGTITCNYDGVNKHLTEIGDNVFIGSNTALVAPVKVADGATVGAGSVITKDVGSGELALTRSRQSNIEGWKRPGKKHS